VQLKRLDMIDAGKFAERQSHIYAPHLLLMTEMIKAGKSNEEIAAKFGCTPLVIDVRRCRIEKRRFPPAATKTQASSEEIRSYTVISDWTMQDGVRIRTIGAAP